MTFEKIVTDSIVFISNFMADTKLDDEVNISIFSNSKFLSFSVTETLLWMNRVRYASHRT